MSAGCVQGRPRLARTVYPQHRNSPWCPDAPVNHAPGMGLTLEEAAEILGVARSTVQRLVLAGDLTRTHRYRHAVLDREEVERLALTRFRRGHPYWCSSGEARKILGLSRTRVRQLTERDRIPGVQHEGRWYFRRHQIENLANARRARRWSTPIPHD